MTELLTLLGFGVATAVFVALHLRSSAGRRARTRAPRCPRCSAVLPEAVSHCPACSVPLQAYELVSARIATDGPEDEGPAHAVVRADVCVGCGTCVAACPEPGALRLVAHLATVDLDRCKGHGQCAAACPVGAIVVTTGAAVQRIEVPDVDVHFQATSMVGLYVVGELGGRGLIKNAVNEGKIAVEHAARSLQTAHARHRAADVFDLVIVGSGPAGLSAGLEAVRSGLTCVVLEQGTIADSIRKYPRQKLLLAEPVKVPLYGDLWVADGSKEMLLQIWQTAIARSGLDVRTEQTVQDVRRDEHVYRVLTADHEYRARRVILALGRRGTPRRLGVPGEELPHVYYDIVEMEAFAGSSVLVVGGGDSAVESALGLANQPDTPVTLSYRGADFGRIKERNRAKLETAVAAGRVRLLLESEVREIRPDAARLEAHGRPVTVPANVVIVRIGGVAPYPFLERIGVRIVRKEIELQPAPAAATG
jgi:thioredoxin reductase/NAD-dependent dihydropyrimidine dehydrogenase PreA subunit